MAAEIRFAGFEGELLDLNGGYGRDTASNHGKPTFKKIDSGTQTVMVPRHPDSGVCQLPAKIVPGVSANAHVELKSVWVAPFPVRNRSMRRVTVSPAIRNFLVQKQRHRSTIGTRGTACNFEGGGWPQKWAVATCGR